MLKRLFTALMGVVLALPVAAQYNSGSFEANEASIYYGVRMGVGSNWLSGGGNSSSLAGMNLGGVLGMRVVKSEAVFLESGLYYTQRGGKDGDYTMNLKYLEVPIVIKYGVKATDDIALLPFIGPYFSWGIGGKYEYPNQVTDEATGAVLRIETADRSSYDLVNHGDMGFEDWLRRRVRHALP